MTYYVDPPITDWQKQIILGTVLGGSSIVKPSKGRNCYLFMRSKNEPWIIYKAKELDNLSSQRPFNREGNNTIRWHSNCYPLFNEFHSLFYQDSKKIVNMEVLDRLRDIGIAVWYGDAGKMVDELVVLNIHKFGQEGGKIIAQFFAEVGIGETYLIKNRNSWRLKFTKESSDKFLWTIAHQLPDFIQLS